jgi:CspA family cold shock protein
MTKGTIKWYNKDKGFGFIMPDEGGRDIYFSSQSIQTPNEHLTDGQRVEYELTVGRKGPEAIKIKAI